MSRQHQSPRLEYTCNSHRHCTSSSLSVSLHWPEVILWNARLVRPRRMRSFDGWLANRIAGYWICRGDSLGGRKDLCYWWTVQEIATCFLSTPAMIATCVRLEWRRRRVHTLGLIWRHRQWVLFFWSRSLAPHVMTMTVNDYCCLSKVASFCCCRGQTWLLVSADIDNVKWKECWKMPRTPKVDRVSVTTTVTVIWLWPVLVAVLTIWYSDALIQLPVSVGWPLFMMPELHTVLVQLRHV